MTKKHIPIKKFESKNIKSNIKSKTRDIFKSNHINTQKDFKKHIDILISTHVV